MELFGRQDNFVRKVQGEPAPCEHIKSRFSLLACFYSSCHSMCHLSHAMDIMVNIFFLCAVSQTEDEWHKWQGWCASVQDRVYLCAVVEGAMETLVVDVTER